MNPNSGRPAIPAQPAQRKVFDVMRPGRAPASSTSRPIIVGHAAGVQDSSVSMNGVGESRQLMDSRKKISIISHDSGETVAPAVLAPANPLAPLPQAAPALVVPPVSQLNPIAAPTPVQHAAPAPSSASAMPWLPPEAKRPESSPAPAPAAPVASFGTPAIPIDVAAADEPAQPEDDLLATMPAPSVDDQPEAPLVSKQVGPKTFPWKWVVPAVIIVVLAIAILDILLDADFISWGVPHTHFL